MLLDFTYDKSNDWYLKEWLPKFERSELEVWQKEIFNFLSDWFSNKDRFEVKTSGTTGPPKIELIPREAFIISAQITISTFNLEYGDTLLMCLPMRFVAGKMMLVRAIVGRMKLILTQPTVNPVEDLEYPITFAAFTPHQLQAILENNSDKLRLIETAIIGGSPVKSELQNQLSDLKTKFLETFGMSETLTHIAIKELNGSNSSEYFKVLKGFNIRVDENEQLIIEADHLKNSPLLTSDIVELIDSDSFKWLSRVDDVINSGGVKLYPTIIEQKLSSVIEEEFIIGKRNDKNLGESVTLFIEGESFNKNKLEVLNIEFTKLLNKYEIPKIIIFIPDFERNENGKIIRSKVG